MNLCKPNSNNALFFSSVDAIPENIWKFTSENKNPYFYKDFLNSIEKNHPEISFFYVVLLNQKEQPIAFASTQIVDFFIEKVKTDIEALIKKAKNIGKKLHIIPAKKPLKLLICGSTFVSGEHGILIEKNQNKKAVINSITEIIVTHVKTTKTLKKQVNGFLLKDFKNESLFISDELKKHKFNPFSVEPNMVLNIHPDWETFDDYLASLKTKFRVKARKTFKQSSAIKITVVASENIEEQLSKMTSLYQKVVANADFNLGSFNLEAYKMLKETFGENYILKAYWIDDKIVGFISGITYQKTLDAHFVGIDYKLNKTLAIYQRMLYNYIEIAIERKIEIINFGRTASQIKSSVGAVPEDLTMYFRHKKTVTNKLIKLFLQKVQPTSFRQNFPFKKTIL